MLDYLHLPPTSVADFQRFDGNSPAAGVTWQKWSRPHGRTMASIFMLGAGGGGGTGVIGANSTAAGGGGGGSGGQTSITIPIWLLPEALYVSVGVGSAGAGIASFVSIHPSTTANHVVGVANGGGAGGNASGATGGTAGSAGSVATAATMPLGFSHAVVLAGQGGVVGGAAIAGGALTLPVTGLRVTGGTGGGGLPAAATNGTAGGAFTVPAAPSPFPPLAGGLASAGTTTPPGNGQHGFSSFNRMFYNYGGTGGGSTHGSATGAGLFQSSGGNGGLGCGAGGMGGALTGSTAGVQGRGGSGVVLIFTW